MFAAPVTMDIAPYRLTGTVYGTLLNHRTAVAALGKKMSQPPYKAPPKAPVLYVKPRNTLATSGDVVRLPADVTQLEIGACLGLVIGRTACRLSESGALEHVAGYLIVNDVSVPHPDYYRPSIRYKARDGFCPLGEVTAREQISDPNDLTIHTYIDGRLAQSASTTELVRTVQRLLVDITEFMTLAPGDVVAVGVAAPAPTANAGQVVRIQCDGLRTLSNSFVAAAT